MTRSETRTAIQIEANKLDMDMHSIAMRLERFAEKHRAPEVDAAALRLLQSRHAVRSHMHKKDREDTNG